LAYSRLADALARRPSAAEEIARQFLAAEDFRSSRRNDTGVGVDGKETTIIYVLRSPAL